VTVASSIPRNSSSNRSMAGDGACLMVQEIPSRTARS
jgi:hypothetical protein